MALHREAVIAAQDGETERALGLFARALELDPRNPALIHNHGLALHRLKRFEEAAGEFTRALALEPGYADAWSNRGLALHELGRVEEAVESFENAIAVQPQHVHAHYNLGFALQRLRRPAEAVEAYDRAIAIEPTHASAWSNRGFALLALGDRAGALDSLERALALEPTMPFLEGHVAFARMGVCDWSKFEERVAHLARRVVGGEMASPPFALLALFDDPALHRLGAETYVRARHPESFALGPIVSRQRGARIRVGYFSADFREHSVSYLTAGLFETHDRRRFEVTGFSFGPPVTDPMRDRLAAAFERFVDVGALGDADIAAFARELEIDIAVDLGGHTKEARTGIFARRAAPVQASYAGYLGTMGAGYYDYLFADAILVPERLRGHYVEKIVRLPSYQANDSKRAAAARDFAPEELGLPQGAFVFCCLNNPYKITPQVFGLWMRILARVPGSVLMLYAGDPVAAANLAAEADRHRVDPGRLVFAQRLPRPEYLSRFRSASLFLDTFPYAAGTVASDALFAGLPVLARMGDSFPSRIAASLLHAIGLPELVATSDADYEALAVELALQSQKLAIIRAKLECNRRVGALFDTAAFTAHMEQALAAMYERRQRGLSPDHIIVAGS